MDAHVADAGQARERVRRDGAAEVDLEAAQRPLLEIGDRLDREQATLSDDADPVAQVLHLGQLMRRDEDGAALGAGLLAEVLELELDEGIQARGGLVEDDQVRPDYEGSDETDLLLVSARQALDALGRIELEALDQPVAVDGVDRAVEVPQVGQQLATVSSE